MRQLDFFPAQSRTKKHGGLAAIGRRKSKRPLDSKRAVHLIMKSSKARGRHGLRASPSRAQAVDAAFHAQAKRFGVKIVSFANVGNHLHAVVRFPNQPAFRGWLRSAAGLIARIATGARKGKPFGKFWDALALTRVVSEGRDFRGLLRYLEGNRIEAEFGKAARERFFRRRAPA